MKEFAKCIGKKRCEYKNLKNLLDPAGKCIKDKLYMQRQFYLQVACGKDHHHITEVNQFSLIQVCLGFGGCLFFIIAMKSHYRWSTKITKRQFQSYAVYAKDYTLEIQLTKKQTDYFANCIYTQNRDRSFGELYMEQLSNQLSSLLNMLYKKKDRAAAEKEKDLFEIALTFFCFHNAKLVGLLDERGDQIRAEDRQQIRKKGKEVHDYITKDIEKLKRPVCAFVTFKTIKGSEIAKKLLTTKNNQGQYP